MNETKPSFFKRLTENPVDILKCILLAVVVVLLLVNVVMLGANRSKMGKVNDELAEVNKTLNGIYSTVYSADVLNVDAIKLQNCDEWLIPVANVRWSGK